MVVAEPELGVRPEAAQERRELPRHGGNRSKPQPRRLADFGIDSRRLACRWIREYGRLYWAALLGLLGRY